MSAERASASDDRDPFVAASLYVVRVQDCVDVRIAGYDGWVYASPPTPHDSALALVGLLLGGAARPMNGACTWTRAVPGGRRTITLAPAPDHTR